MISQHNFKSWLYRFQLNPHSSFNTSIYAAATNGLIALNDYHRFFIGLNNHFVILKSYDDQNQKYLLHGLTKVSPTSSATGRLSSFNSSITKSIKIGFIPSGNNLYEQHLLLTGSIWHKEDFYLKEVAATHPLKYLIENNNHVIEQLLESNPYPPVDIRLRFSTDFPSIPYN